MQIDDTRVLITGATSGIGWELTRQLTGRGATVFATGRSAARQAQLTAETGAIGAVADLTDPDACARLADEAAMALGGLDIVIANAGVQHLQDFTDSWDGDAVAMVGREVATNLSAPVLLFGAAYQYLRESAGAFIGVSSGLAYAPKRTAPVYCATKAGLSTFLTAARYQAEAAGHGVTIQEAVMPLVATPMTEGRHEGAMSPKAAAEAVIAGITSGRDLIAIGKTRQLQLLLRVAPSVARRITRDH